MITVQVWGRPPVCRFTESLTPCPSGRWNTGPEARLTGRPEVCPTFRPEQLQGMNHMDRGWDIENGPLSPALSPSEGARESCRQRWGESGAPDISERRGDSSPMLLDLAISTRHLAAAWRSE